MQVRPQSSPATRKKIRLMAAVLSALIWGAYVFWHRDTLAADPALVYVPNAGTSALFATTLGYGLASIVGLTFANWRRMRALLRPNLGRILGALALIFVTPFAVVDWLPWIIGGLFIFGTQSLANFVDIALKVWPLALWYVPACLIISGTKSKWLRFGLFCLMFWSALSALILTYGVTHFGGF